MSVDITKNVDMALVERIKAGDIDAFEELFNRYQKRIYNLIYRMVDNEQDANDLTQEVFIRVYNSINTIRTDASFAAWIRTVAINITRDFFRKKKRTVKTDSYDAAINMDNGDIERQIEDISPNPHNILESKETSKIVEKAISSLSQQHKEVIILHHIDGQDVENIAAALNLPVGTVKSRLARARDNLKRKLSSIV